MGITLVDVRIEATPPGPTSRKTKQGKKLMRASFTAFTSIFLKGIASWKRVDENINIQRYCRQEWDNAIDYDVVE